MSVTQKVKVCCNLSIYWSIIAIIKGAQWPILTSTSMIRLFHKSIEAMTEPSSWCQDKVTLLEVPINFAQETLWICGSFGPIGPNGYFLSHLFTSKILWSLWPSQFGPPISLSTSFIICFYLNFFLFYDPNFKEALFFLFEFFLTIVFNLFSN